MINLIIDLLYAYIDPRIRLTDRCAMVDTTDLTTTAGIADVPREFVGVGGEEIDRTHTERPGRRATHIRKRTIDLAGIRSLRRSLPRPAPAGSSGHNRAA